MVEPKIEKQNTRFREAIPAEVKLAITLRYLATGDSFTSLMYLFKVSKQFISSVLPGVLKAIIEGLQDYVKVKTFIIIINWLHLSNIIYQTYKYLVNIMFYYQG